MQRMLSHDAIQLAIGDWGIPQFIFGRASNVLCQGLLVVRILEIRLVE